MTFPVVPLNEHIFEFVLVPAFVTTFAATIPPLFTVFVPLAVTKLPLTKLVLAVTTFAATIPLSLTVFVPLAVTKSPLTKLLAAVTTFAATIPLSVITLPVVPEKLHRSPDVLVPTFETMSFAARVLTEPTTEPEIWRSLNRLVVVA